MSSSRWGESVGASGSFKKDDSESVEVSSHPRDKPGCGRLGDGPSSARGKGKCPAGEEEGKGGKEGDVNKSGLKGKVNDGSVVIISSDTSDEQKCLGSEEKLMREVDAFMEELDEYFLANTSDEEPVQLEENEGLECEGEAEECDDEDFEDGDEDVEEDTEEKQEELEETDGDLEMIDLEEEEEVGQEEGDESEDEEEFDSEDEEEYDSEDEVDSESGSIFSSSA